jgi:hypothetical protein
MRKPRKKSSDGAAALENHQHTDLHRGFFFLNKSAMTPKFQIPTSNFQGNSKSKIPKTATGAIHLEIGGSKFLWDLVLGIWDF